MLVERANFFGRGSLQRIEAYEYQFAEWIVASADDTGAQTLSDELKSVPDRIGTRRTGIGDNLGRDPQMVRLECIVDRFLRSIVSNQSGETLAGFGSKQAPVIGFAKTHPTARRPDYDQLWRRAFGGFTSLPQRHRRHPSTPMQAVRTAPPRQRALHPLVRDLGCGFASGFSDVKGLHQPHCVSALQKRSKIGAQVRAEGRNHPNPRHQNTM